MTSIPEYSPRTSPSGTPTKRDLIGARMDRLPHGRIHTLVLICSSIMFVFEICDQGAIGLAATPVRAYFHSDLNGVAFAVSATYFGLLVGSVVAGRSDHLGRRGLLAWGVAGMSVFSGLSGASTSLVMLVVLRFLSGLGLGIVYITLIVYVSEMFRARRRALVIGLGVGLGTVANIGLTRLAEHVVPMGANGWRVIFFVGFAGLVAVPFFRHLPESPRWLAAHGREAEAEVIVRGMEAEAEARRGAPLPEPEPPLAQPVEETPAKDRDDTRALFRGKFLIGMVMSMIIWIGFSLGQQLMNSWAPTVLGLRGFTPQQALNTHSYMLTGTLIGSAIAVLAGNRIPRRAGLIVFGTFGAVAFVVFGLSTSHLVIALAGAGVHIAVGMNTPLANTFVAERFPTQLRARGSGITYSVGRLTNVIAPFTIAGALEALGYKAAAWGGFAAWGLVALVVAVLGGNRWRTGEEADRAM
ncbi:MFS transporter [Streptomyces sp. NPDC001255]|uniref:MFS transporter n=1 Tax=Streptomyces sp. NPDC001255 TaxID=3364550 RepID=UPI0036B8B549